ncbi:MAG: hypothetical protein IPL61_18510 [Myxococcales bacterium]|nr:hypothetical protein [Myxococcales bacterium]
MREDQRPPAPSSLPRARVRGGRDGVAWMIAAAMVPPGWALIGHAHRWHLTPSVIVLGLAWLAVVGAGLALVRAGNAVVDTIDDDWFVAGGSRDDLEREKKSLVRAIKDIEFDRDTGKLTAADAQALIGGYRARAIEVIKMLELGGGLGPRERILAELQARAVIDRKTAKAAKIKAKAKGGKADKVAKAEQAEHAEHAEQAAKAKPAPVEAAPIEAEPADDPDDPDEAPDAPADATDEVAAREAQVQAPRASSGAAEEVAS